MRLTTRDHDRGAAGMTYVYPVVSRRAGGVSVGVNLNPNRACNWRCIYCQVPALVRGAGPAIDLARLEEELSGMLGSIVHDAWMDEHVPPGSRRLNDVAFSGDGEPTTSPDLLASIDVAARVLEGVGLLGELPVVLITNGSLIHKPEVQAGLARLAGMNGEVWFKLDSATREGRARLNDTGAGDERVLENLVSAAGLCRTRLQTMALALDGRPPGEAEQVAWIALVGQAQERGARLEDVLLYGLERESQQPEAPRLSRVPVEWLERFARRVRDEVGLEVRVHP